VTSIPATCHFVQQLAQQAVVLLLLLLLLLGDGGGAGPTLGPSNTCTTCSIME
jgi:hypothetical protein